MIGLDEIRDLLRTADIAPTWHENIINIAYHPYTRVDVRRMHKLGVLTDDELTKAYMDLGYNEEKATNMALFTILYNSETEREGSKSDVLKGYNLGYWRRDKAKELILSIGISEDWAEYYLDIEDLRRELSLVEEEVVTIQSLYTSREITRAQADARFGPLNLTAERIRRLYEKWDTIRERKITRPSRSDLERWFRQDQIDEVQLAAELAKRGYVTEYVDKYVQDLMIRLLVECMEAEAKAREEAAKVAAREIKTAYDTARARKDVAIATLQVSKAEDKLLLLSVENAEDEARLKTHVKECDVSIAQLIRDKAHEKVEFLGTS